MSQTFIQIYQKLMKVEEMKDESWNLIVDHGEVAMAEHQGLIEQKDHIAAIVE